MKITNIQSLNGVYLRKKSSLKNISLFTQTTEKLLFELLLHEWFIEQASKSDFITDLDNT